MHTTTHPPHHPRKSSNHGRGNGRGYDAPYEGCMLTRVQWRGGVRQRETIFSFRESQFRGPNKKGLIDYFSSSPDFVAVAVYPRPGTSTPPPPPSPRLVTLYSPSTPGLADDVHGSIFAKEFVGAHDIVPSLSRWPVNWTGRRRSYISGPTPLLLSNEYDVVWCYYSKCGVVDATGWEGEMGATRRFKSLFRGRNIEFGWSIDY